MSCKLTQPSHVCCSRADYDLLELFICEGLLLGSEPTLEHADDLFHPFLYLWLVDVLMTNC